MNPNSEGTNRMAFGFLIWNFFVKIIPFFDLTSNSK